MKKVKIDVFDCSFFVYKHDELARFNKDFSADVKSSWHGAVAGNGVWINDTAKDIIGVCYHEACHLADWVLEERLKTKQRDLYDNQEIRAYLIEFIGNWIRKVVHEGD